MSGEIFELAEKTPFFVKGQIILSRMLGLVN